MIRSKSRIKGLGVGMVLAAALALVLGSSSPAAAIPVVDLNDGSIQGMLDVLRASAGPNDIRTPNIAPFFDKDLGDLTNTVFSDNETGIFTYIEEVFPQNPGANPNVSSVDRFRTAFAPLGLTGSAGWDFSQAATAAGSGDGSGDFTFVITPLDRLSWIAAGNLVGNWNPGETITFFYQSFFGPSLTGNYSTLSSVSDDINDAGAVGLSYAPNPIPEPSTFFLLGSAMVVLGLVIRRRRS